MIIGLLFVGVGIGRTGDAWSRTTQAASRLARIDASIGWWLIVCGSAMVAVQLTIFVRA
jgi:hypothetical protein